MALSFVSRMWRLGDRLTNIASIMLHPFARGERVVNVGGFDICIRKGTADLFVAREALAHDDYRVAPRGIVVDLGGNIGSFSLLASKTATKVIALEPDPANYAQFVKNMDLNKVENVIPLNMAIGGYNGTGVLHSARNNKASSSLVVDVSDDTIDIEVCTLSKLMSDNDIDRIDLLKVDIEGSEYQLFEQVEADELSRIETIVMETHRLPGHSPDVIVAKLEANGFNVKRRRTKLSMAGLDYFYATRDGAG